MKYELICKLFEDFKKQQSINEANLKKILYDNRDTSYGKMYQFSTIKTIDEFQKKVPLTDYTSYRNTGTVSAYSYRYTLHSSGTTNVPKKIYLSNESLHRYSGYLYLMPLYLTNMAPKNMIHVNMFNANPQESILSEVCYNYFFDEGFANFDSFIGGRPCLFCNEKIDIPYVKLWCALACEELSAILSTFLYDVLLLMNYLEENWRRLLFDIEHHIISVPLPHPIHQTLLDMKVSTERITFLKGEFEKGFDTPIIQRIWKNLKFITGISGKMFSAYDIAIKRYTGDIPIYYFGYAQSECLSAIATELNKASYTLLPQSAFFEFLDMNTGNVYLPNEVKIGHKYQLITTTFSGVYRYKTGDLVKIVGFTGQSPNIQICGRIEHILNIDGEKTSEEIINATAQQLITQYGINLSTYYVGIDHSTIPSRYVLFLEALKNNDLDFHQIASIFDLLLQNNNWDYADLRSKHLIGNLICIPISREELAATQTGQKKPGIIMPESRVSKLLQNYQLLNKRSYLK